MDRTQPSGAQFWKKGNGEEEKQAKDKGVEHAYMSMIMHVMK